jgi:L-iditol 2-dehydrogenase
VKGETSMKAAVFYAPNDLRVESIPTPGISEDELLIKVAACAVCGSDVRTFRFGASNITKPVTMGHEITGTITRVGTRLNGFSAGQRVAVAPAVPCGECHYCQRGIQTMCDNLRSIGYQYDGGFAEYMVVPHMAIKAGCVNPIPAELSFEQATLAEPLACAINAQELLAVQVEDVVAIFGSGPLGCIHANLAKVRGARKVILIDVQPQRLELARGFGADLFLTGDEESIRRGVMDATQGAGASVIIVAAPSAKAQEQALTVAAKQGRISFFGGLPKSSPCMSLNANLVHYKELFIMGAYGSKPRHNRLALELLATGRIQVSRLLGMAIPLERIQEGLQAISDGKVLKVVVQPNGN